MSGINSSARDAAPAPEALSFTVHSMPAPDLQAQRRRQLGGRWRMLLVLLACAAPVLASYFAYYVWRPEGRTNYSDMILPTRAMPADLALRTLDGTSVDAASLKGQWLLMVVGPAACDPACEQRIYLQRQLREMLGKERDRVDRIWLITDEAAPAVPLMEAAQATAGFQPLRVDPAALARWLAPGEGQPIDAHVYIVDPMGQWMMRAPASPEPARLKRDMDRLLRASAFWDRAGR